MSAPTSNTPADSPEPSQPEQKDPAPAAKPVNTTPAVKQALLKVIDITALGFLEPVVRLCYGEEPQVQIRKIGRFIVVPILAMIAFVILWAGVAPFVKTKSGELPVRALSGPLLFRL